MSTQKTLFEIVQHSTSRKPESDKDLRDDAQLKKRKFCPKWLEEFQWLKYESTEKQMKCKVEGLPGGGPCSLVPFQYCPMFPHILYHISEFFRTVIFRILFPCSQKLANVPLFPSIFCQCSLVPQNPWETLKVCLDAYGRKGNSP